jgi:hypothetical protein
VGRGRGHGGGVNLDGGHSGWPVHGEVAGSCGGEVVGEATGRVRRGRRGRCACGEARELHQLDSKPPERGGGNSLERGETTAPSLIGSRGGGGSGRGWCEEMRGSRRSFYRQPRGEEEEVACIGEARCDSDDGGIVVATGRLGHSAWRRKAPNIAGERVMARRRGGRWPGTIASMVDHGRGGRG